ncbi:MAG: hypothetical protein A2798_02250 [Candidatus Levybacteria bacterium RIFCSPHIGHO2_01_FULL_37_17]|nr:MAG: hypothetical protein A2798_02250 [Candidatus Levybacteria bacterium RIFCSPHIGHO2_01_FULL_37_17]OGH36700.1 MAG: hypothetical protein A2959_00240 [Candidatus Levybacteria bacterium RIFCSPLOWO2_01_FULL_38_23]
MFTVAFLTGIYSYIIFILGILNKLYSGHILLFTFAYLVLCVVLFRIRIKDFYLKIKKRTIRLHNLPKLFFSLIIIQCLINFIGALGPELSFDALWYHLTLPKLFFEQHSIFFIQGNLLYYSLFPKLGEMLYIASLSINGEILAKILHYTFGILTLLVIYKISKKFLNNVFSTLACLIFSSNLVFAWQSTTAYIDLFRTFFEVLALWAFLNKDTVKSAVSLGFAISTKLSAIGSIPIFAVLYLIFDKKNFRSIILFTLLALIIPSPWFIFSFINSGRLFYPLFTDLYPDQLILNVSPLDIVVDFFKLFLYSPDPISPLYLILLPVVFILYKKLNRHLKILAVYSLLSLIIWYFIPRTGGGRFILPYLPAFSILSAGVIFYLDMRMRKFLLIIAVLIALTTIFYRGATNAKFVPVIIGSETKEHFLSVRLNFNFGDFYDIDSYFAKNLTSSDRVLLYGFHNLYYVEFPFIDSSWIKRGDRFNYIATQNIQLPDRFKDWMLIYYNKVTGVKLFTHNKTVWIY